MPDFGHDLKCFRYSVMLQGGCCSEFLGRCRKELTRTWLMRALFGCAILLRKNTSWQGGQVFRYLFVVLNCSIDASVERETGKMVVCVGSVPRSIQTK